MKLLFREYTASLGERRDLERLLPDVISERGFTVLSRAGRGARQYGVDVLARGPHPDDASVEAAYMITIKGADIGRADWDAPKQGVRASLNEIIDVYIPTHLPSSLADKRKVIVVACGGEIKEAVRLSYTQVVKTIQERHPDIVVVEWNGDQIADLLLSGLLREEVFGPELVSSFRKSLAFCDEPEICAEHFIALLDTISQRELDRRTDQLRAVRQILVALYTLFGWCVQADNLEGAYRSSEAAALYAWDIARNASGVKSKAAKQLFEAMIGITNLHLNIADIFLAKNVVPCLGITDGLSMTVPSSASIDVNLRAFDTLGRLAMSGHWKLQEAYARMKKGLDHAELRASLATIANQLESLVDDNPVLLSPATDVQVTDVDLAAHLLLALGRGKYVGHWISQMSQACQFAYQRRSHFPMATAQYEDLARNETTMKDQQDALTQASVLWPTLQVWLARVGSKQDRRELNVFLDQHLKHCSHQFWMPGPDSEDAFWRNTGSHGIAVHELNWGPTPESKIEWAGEECTARNDFSDLSSNRATLWSLTLAACRRYQLPVPLHFHGLLNGITEELNSAHTQTTTV